MAANLPANVLRDTTTLVQHIALTARLAPAAISPTGEIISALGNKSVSLPDDGTKYTNRQKVVALARRVWNDRSGGNLRVNEVLSYVLYGGPDEQLPERLWSAVSERDYKIEGLGISALGELVGWARPDEFPPRNGRTSKALRSLGFDVKVHVQ